MNSGTFDIGTPAIATKAKRDINDKGITQKEFRAFRGTRVFKREEQIEMYVDHSSKTKSVMDGKSIAHSADEPGCKWLNAGANLMRETP